MLTFFYVKIPFTKSLKIVANGLKKLNKSFKFPALDSQRFSLLFQIKVGLGGKTTQETINH